MRRGDDQPARPRQRQADDEFGIGGIAIEAGQTVPAPYMATASGSKSTPSTFAPASCMTRDNCVP